MSVFSLHLNTLTTLIERNCSHCRLQGAVGPFLNYANLIDCSFSTTNENDVILGRFYVGPILLLVQRAPDSLSHRLNMRLYNPIYYNIVLLSFFLTEVNGPLHQDLGWSYMGQS